MKTIRSSAAVVVLSLATSVTAFAGHPPVTLLDQAGKNVLDTGRPISTMRSCGHCHDTQYIAAHCYHVSLGSDERAELGTTLSRRPWDRSPGAFGRWDPLAYRYLSPRGSARPDLGTAEWIATFPRHVGGGPASPEQESGVEMNCFLCHMPKPDNQARVKELQERRFQWANTATLASAGLVHKTQDGWAYARAAFLPDGRLDARKLGIREPKSENCGLCHGLADRGGQPLKLEFSLQQWSTATKGQVFSPQRVSESAVNLKDKEHLARPWDVHAERLLECASCHFSINNPAFSEPASRSRPKHLVFDPRRLAPGEYLEQPSHQFAKGHTSQGTVARHLSGTMRRCEDCHNAAATHDWLPYQKAHFARLSCEACHVPQVYAPAVRQIDWTMLTPSGEPQIQWRGIDGDPNDSTIEVTGFRPVLLPREGLDGRTRLVPHNLISAWYWVEGSKTPRPVRLTDLKAALLQDGKYHAEVARALGNGRAVLDTPDKVAVVRRRLEAVGVVEPRIEAEVQPYSLHHGVGPAKWATRKCETCHMGDSRLGEGFALASYVPGGVPPKPVGDSGAQLSGRVHIATDGQLTYEPATRQASLYVLGHDKWLWVNALGGLSLIAVMLGIAVHAGMRLRMARTATRAERTSTLVKPRRESPKS